MMYTSQEGELYVSQARALGAIGVLPKTVRPVDVSRVLYQLHLLPDRRTQRSALFDPTGGQYSATPTAVVNPFSPAAVATRSAVGDVDGDGLADVYVTHLNTETNTLWKQGPRGVFQDRTGEAGLAATRGTGFGTVLADFDNDGRPDLGVVNGRVYLGGAARDSGLGFWETYAEKNLLLANLGGGRFKDVSADTPAVCGHWNVGRGLVAAAPLPPTRPRSPRVLVYDDEGVPEWRSVNVAEALSILHYGSDSGAVPGQRLGVSHAINRAARAAAGWRELRRIEEWADALDQLNPDRRKRYAEHVSGRRAA